MFIVTWFFNLINCGNIIHSISTSEISCKYSCLLNFLCSDNSYISYSQYLMLYFLPENIVLSSSNFNTQLGEANQF